MTMTKTKNYKKINTKTHRHRQRLMQSASTKHFPPKLFYQQNFHNNFPPILILHLFSHSLNIWVSHSLLGLFQYIEARGDDDYYLNCFKNGEHREGVEALSNNLHHIRVGCLWPDVMLLIFKYLIGTRTTIYQRLFFDLSESVKLFWLCFLPQDFHHCLPTTFQYFFSETRKPLWRQQRCQRRPNQTNRGREFRRILSWTWQQQSIGVNCDQVK